MDTGHDRQRIRLSFGVIVVDMGSRRPKLD